MAQDCETTALSKQERQFLFGDDLIFDLRLTGFVDADTSTKDENTVLSRYGLCPIDSPGEKQAFVQASQTVARLTAELGGLKINGLPIGSAVAMSLHSTIKDEEHYFACLEALVSRGEAWRVTIITHSRFSPLEAALVRMVETGRVKVDEVVELVNGNLHPQHGIVSFTEIFEQMVQPRPRVLDQKFALPSVAVETPQSNDRSFDANSQLPLVVLDSAADFSAIHYQHTIQVLNAMEQRNQDYRLLSLVPIDGHAEKLVSFQNLQHAHIIGFDTHDLASFRSQIPRVRDYLVRALASASLRPDPTKSITLHLLSANGLLFNYYRKIALNYLSIQSAMTLPTRSVWIGSYIGAIFQTVIENTGGTPVFSGPTASISHHIRNFPFIEPRVQILAYGTSVCDIYRKRNIEPEGRVHLVGPLFYDQKPHHLNRTRSTSEAKTVLLMTARMNPDAEDAWFLPLAEWVISHGYTFKIRQHPNRPRNYHKVLHERFSNARKVTYSQNETAEECIDAANLVISDVSTSSIISAAHRIPLIQVEVKGQEFEYNDLSGFGVSVKTSDADETIAATRTILENLVTDGSHWNKDLTDADYDGFDAAYCHRSGKTPADSVVDFLLNPPPTPKALIHGASLMLENIRDGLPA